MSVFLCNSPRSQLLQLKKEKLEYIPGEHEHGLFPAPIHVGMSRNVLRYLVMDYFLLT